MENTYTYAVYTHEPTHTPLHIVEIHAHCLATFAVFGCAKDANRFILRKQGEIPGLHYDPEADPNKYLTDIYTQAMRLCSRVGDDDHQLFIA